MAVPYLAGKRPRFAYVGPRCVVGAKVGQLPYAAGDVAPGGTVGETTAKPRIGQDALGALRWPGGLQKHAKGNYGLSYHLSHQFNWPHIRGADIRYVRRPHRLSALRSGISPLIADAI